MLQFLRTRTNFRAWVLLTLALFAFDSISPALASMMGTRAPTGFVEVCTQEGMKRVSVANEAGKPADSSVDCFKCPLCTSGGGHAAIDSPRWQGAEPQVEAPVCAARRPPSFTFLPLPPSRGPPQHS